MLAELAEELRSRGVRLLIARDIGQVGDVVANVIKGHDALEAPYPTVRAAVAAAQAPAPAEPG